MAIDADRRLLFAVVLALAAVVALGVAAATLDTAVDAGSGGLPTGGGSPSDDAEFGLDNETETDDPSDDDFAISGASLPFCYPWLDRPPAVAGIVGAFLVVGAVAYVRTDSTLPPLAFLAAFGPPVFIAHTLLTHCSDGGGWSFLASLLADLRGPFVAGEGGGVGVGGSGVTAPTAALSILLLVALVGAVFLLVVATGDGGESAAGATSDEDERADREGVAAVARTAGQAADRIEGDADADNEIFRAWATMTDDLDVRRPESSTPAEFADAAVGAGMDRADVEELTELFAAVRYGGADATDAREERAVAALRRIESEYGDEP